MTADQICGCAQRLDVASCQDLVLKKTTILLHDNHLTRRRRGGECQHCSQQQGPADVIAK
eukprot:10526905-Prorocentrum_lima.AAC.1